MCDIMEELFRKESEKWLKQELYEEHIRFATDLITNGKLTLEEIAKFSKLPLDEVQRLAQSLTDPTTQKGNTAYERGDIYRKSRGV